MEFILDTVNLEEIKDGVDHMTIAGVTSHHQKISLDI